MLTLTLATITLWYKSLHCVAILYITRNKSCQKLSFNCYVTLSKKLTIFLKDQAFFQQ